MKDTDHGGRREMETSWDHGQNANLVGCLGRRSEAQASHFFFLSGNKCECTLKADLRALVRDLGWAQLGEVQRQVRHKQDRFLLGSSCSQFAFFHSAFRTVINVCHMLFPHSCSTWGQSCIPGSGVCFDGLPDVLKLVDFIHVNFSFSVTCCFFKKKAISVVAMESPAYLMRLNHRIYSAATENIWKYVRPRAAVLRSLAAL